MDALHNVVQVPRVDAADADLVILQEIDVLLLCKEIHLGSWQKTTVTGPPSTQPAKTKSQSTDAMDTYI